MGKVIGYVRVVLERLRRGTRSSVEPPQEGISIAATDISYDDRANGYGSSEGGTDGVE
jgi:hypothetical protein